MAHISIKLIFKINVCVITSVLECLLHVFCYSLSNFACA